MSIIRSNIARQLLAEGGAPRASFRSGGGRTDANTMSGSGASFDDGFGGGDEFGRDTYAEQLSDLQRTENTFPNISDVSGDDLRNISIRPDGRSDAPSIFDYTPINLLKRADARFIGPFRDKSNLARRTEFLRRQGLIGPGEEELPDKYQDSFLKSEAGLDMLRGMGYTTIQDVINNRGEGGDNEPIKKLRAPITEKKEKPKDEFDDILKFYGARFAEGGSPGNTTSQRVLPRADGRRPGYYGSDAGFGDDDYKDESASFDAGSGSGGSDQDFAAARAAIMGPSTYTDDSGNTIDVSNLQKQGFTQSKIAEMLGPLATQYGLQQEQPEVLGVLGGAPEPSVTFGQEVPDGLLGTTGTKGTKGATGLGFAFTPEAPIAIDKVFGSGLKDRTKMYEDVFKADGGAIRQNYGLGSIVKKIGRTVKKVAKSPIGKAALFAGLGAYGLGVGPFGASGAFANAKGAGFLKSKFMKDLLLKKGKDEFTFGNLSPLSLLSIPTVASYLMAKKEENEDETLPTVSNTDPEFQKYLAFYGGPRRFAQTGGDIDEAPMKSMPRQEIASYGYNDAMSDTYQMFLQMKEKDLIPPEMKFDEFLQEVVPEMSKRQGTERTMAAGGGMMNPNDEMLNLGGNEMDLRGGGFVPLGEYEKKDDVPARLSKNEFVFTADAVRAAGGGSVDRGADLMYKTMKNLENKVV